MVWVPSSLALSVPAALTRACACVWQMRQACIAASDAEHFSLLYASRLNAPFRTTAAAPRAALQCNQQQQKNHVCGGERIRGASFHQASHVRQSGAAEAAHKNNEGSRKALARPH